MYFQNPHTQHNGASNLGPASGNATSSGNQQAPGGSINNGQAQYLLSNRERAQQLSQQQLALQQQQQQQQPSQPQQPSNLQQMQALILQRQLAHQQRQHVAARQQQQFNNSVQNSVMAPAAYPQGATPSLSQQPPQSMQKVNHPFQQQQQQQIMQTSYHPNQAWSTHYITNKMTMLVQKHPKDYYDAFVGLSSQHRFVMNSTVVFRFAPRPAVRSNGVEDRAMFFLQILRGKKNTVADKPAELVGLRCACCFKVIQYVPGSSNFVDVKSEIVVQKLKSAVVGRLAHMASCRYVTEKEQRMLTMYKPRQSENDALIRFLMKWHKVLLALWFQDLSAQTTPSNGLSPLNGLQPLMENRRSYFDTHPDEVTEENFYDDLLTSMTAARYMKRGEVVFDDLSEGPVSYDDGKETPLMETFLQNYQLRVKRRGHQCQIRIHCQHCSSSGGGSHGINKLLSTEIVDEDYKDMSMNLWRFVVQHCCRECKVMPTEVKEQFLRGPQDPPLANLLIFFKAWKAYLQQILRWTKVDLSPKPETADVYLPLSKEQMQRYEPIECKRGNLEENKPQWSQPQNCGPDDVILDSEAHRDWGGNRRFRQLISKHRGIYHSLNSPSQQQLIVETLTDLIFKKGGKFCKLDNMAFAYNIGRLNSLAHVTHCLRNGFPEMLRPPMRFFRGSYKVYQVVFPPKVGVLHGNIRWGNMSSQVLKLSDYAEREDYMKFRDWRKSVASASQPTRTTGARSETSETSETLVTDVEEAPWADSKSAEENATEHVPHNHKLTTAAAEKRSQQSRSDEVTFPKPSTDVTVSSKHRTSNASRDVVDLTAPNRKDSPSPDVVNDCKDKNRAERNQPVKRKSLYDNRPQSPAKARGVSHHGTPNHGRSPVVSALSSALPEEAGREIKRLRLEEDTEYPPSAIQLQPSTAGIVSGGLSGHHNSTEENALTVDNPSNHKISEETDVAPTNSEHGFSTQTKRQYVVTPTIRGDQKKGTSPLSAGIRGEADVEVIVIDDSSDSDGNIDL